MSWKEALEELGRDYGIGTERLAKVAEVENARERRQRLERAISDVLQGASIYAAAKKYGVPYETLRKRIRKLYPRLRRRPLEPLPSGIQKQVILSCLLSDAKFNKIGSSKGKLYTGAGIIIRRSVEQRGYVEWKYQQLKSLATKPPRVYERRVKDKKHPHPEYGFYIRANLFTRSLRGSGRTR